MSVLLAAALSVGTGIRANAFSADVTAKADGEAASAAEGGSTVSVTPSDDGKTFSVDNEKIAEYFDNYTLGYSENYYGCGEYTTKPVTLSWETVGKYYQVYLSDEKHFVNAEKYLTATNELTLDNVVPDHKYYWKVKTTAADGAESFSDVYTFTPTAKVRTMNIDGVDNMRDLGGLKTTDGKAIKYGIIYRSANLDSITEAGRDKIKKLGIKTDIDLRGATSAVSPLGDNVKRLNFNAPYYVDETDGSGKQSGLDGDEAYIREFVAAVKACADPNNYPLDFHCAIGRDRTGTLAAMLYAISGVSRYDIVREYELSWFSTSAANNPFIKVSAINKLCNYIEGLDGATFKDKASGYLLRNGVTQAEIDSVRNILTGVTKIADDKTPVTGGTAETPTETDDFPIFEDGNFGYSGERTAMNVYEGSSVTALSASEAATNGVPAGYSGNVLKITSAANATAPYQFDTIIDFTEQKIKRSLIESITLKLYVVSTDKDNAKHPAVRIPTHDAKDWILLPTAATPTDCWTTITLTSEQIDKLCAYGGGYLTKFDLALRSEAATTMYVDEITVTKTVATDNEPPVINVPSETIVTTDGTFADDIFTVTDDSGKADVDIKWSNGAVDRRGRLTAGNHTLTITASDASDNITTETINFTVTKEPEVKLYKITFRSGTGDDIEVVYSDGENKQDLTLPAVPNKKYYNGSWGDFTLEKTNDQIVNAVYTPITYTVYFKADGQTVAQVTYTVENTDISVPQVPQKDGYTGKWSDYSLNGGDKIVNAVYEKISSPEPDPEKPEPQPSKPTKKSGCGGSVGCSAGLLALGAMAIVVKKKKK